MAHLKTQYIKNMLEIAIWNDMTQCTEAEVRRMMPLVGEQRRQQAIRYTHTFGQYCCLRSWLMLQDLLGHPPSEWHYNEHGKPFLIGNEATTYFSISHCREAIAVAISDKVIGIDAESIRHADEALVARTMTEAEQSYIHSHAQPDRAFIVLWTRKEAILKGMGIGIESFEQLQTLSVLDDSYNELALTTVEKDKYIYSIAN